MINASILAAFERLWQHILAKIGEMTSSAQAYTDNAVAQKSQVQIITWEEND